jgi:hypothetical protein
MWPIKWLIDLLLKKVPPRNGNKTLVLWDWDNFLMGLQTRFAPDEVKLSSRIEKLMTWIENECGELVEVGGKEKGFVFAPEHLQPFYQDICVVNRLHLNTCPKRKIADENESMDSVDEEIIWFGKLMLRHPDIGCICIVSADQHFLPLLREAKESGLRIAVAISAKGSLSKQKPIIEDILFLVDKSPITGRKMFIEADKL